MYNERYSVSVLWVWVLDSLGEDKETNIAIVHSIGPTYVLLLYPENRLVRKICVWKV